jgi:hypothetical protein
MRRATILAGVLAGLLYLAGRGAAGDVPLTSGDLVWEGPSLWRVPALDLPAPDATLPVVAPHDDGDGAALLRHLAATRDLDGFDGVLYDNRDRGHSVLREALFPRLARLSYGPDLVQRSLDYGLAGQILLPAVVLGNSSTAITSGANPRSLPRLAMTRPDLAAESARLYEQNAIYVYPEHRDHDAEDRFPANWPYMITSQGSSGSDKPFLRAVAMTLAAFPTDTFAALREKGLVAPTVQMILRRNLAPVRGREAYFTGAAHPVVFDAGLLRPGRMVAQAAALRPDEIPPQVRLRVVDEEFSHEAGLTGRDEHLLDTPSAIARLWRNFAWSREITVTAAETQDPNGRDLTFRWALLRGNPDRVEIVPLGEDGRSARIRINWQDPYAEPVRGDPDVSRRSLSRIDIGVFVENGAEVSAPSFVSVFFPGHQRRVYAAGGSGAVRLVSIDYDAIAREAYYDPLLFWSAPWTDRAVYDAQGALTGWQREWRSGRSAFVRNEAAPEAETHYSMDGAQSRWPQLRYE